mmetsp:Transcript_132140/g.313238  ORF Transcript_132140/g.313238 Transcript_132140/m.313238 type:complete len:217 (+) Transcript_132140:699-1349(+)
MLLHRELGAAREAKPAADPDRQGEDQRENGGDNDGGDKLGKDHSLVCEGRREEDVEGDGQANRSDQLHEPHKEVGDVSVQRPGRPGVPCQQQLLVNPVLHAKASDAHQRDEREHRLVEQTANKGLDGVGISPRRVHRPGSMGPLERLDLCLRLLPLLLCVLVGRVGASTLRHIIQVGQALVQTFSHRPSDHVTEVAVRHQRRHDGVDEQHRKRAVY